MERGTRLAKGSFWWLDELGDGRLRVQFTTGQFDDRLITAFVMPEEADALMAGPSVEEAMHILDPYVH